MAPSGNHPTPDQPPLWRLMHHARLMPVTPTRALMVGKASQAALEAAAEIRAFRDHLIQWSRLHDLDQEARNAVYRHLTDEADRAESGQ